MANLAQTGRRDTTQRRGTLNRDSTLPTRRLDTAPDAQVRSDMRNAYRSNDDADAVKRVLGMVNDTAEKFVELDNQRFEQRSKEEAAQGVQDVALNRVDEGLASRSTAYRTAISWSRVRRRAAEMEVAIVPEVEELLARGSNADPTNGDEVIDLEDVNALLDDRFKTLLLDEEGNPVDFGDPAAQSYLYEKLNDVRTRVNTRAAEIIRDQEIERVVTGLADEVELDAKEGTLDIESYMQRGGTLGIDRRALKSAFIAAAVNGVRASENPDILLQLADSRRADGTPSWSPAEENQLREAYFTMNTQFEAKKEREALERSNETLGRLELQVRSGQPLNVAAVRELIETDQLRPEDADVAFAIQERYEDEQWQDVQRARANISWNQSQADRRRAAADRSSGGGSPAYNSIKLGILSGDLSGPAALRAARGAMADGRLSIAQYEDLTERANRVPNSTEIVRERDAGGQRSHLEDVIARGGRLAGTPGHVSRQVWEQRAQRAQETFYGELRAGASPATALANGLVDLGAGQRTIQRSVRDAAQSNPLDE